MTKIALTVRQELETVGFTCLVGYVPSAQFAELRTEALGLRQDALDVSRTSGQGYRARLAGLGSAGQAFLASATMEELVKTLFDSSLAPDPGASCYTYYGPGDYLGAHIDHPKQCLATAILYLEVIRAQQPGAGTGLELHILEGDPGQVSAAPRAILPTTAGALILGLGSVHWHARPQLQPGEHLVALTACYSRPIAV